MNLGSECRLSNYRKYFEPKEERRGALLIVPPQRLDRLVVLTKPDIERRKGVRYHVLSLRSILQRLEDFQCLVALARHRVGVTKIAQCIIGAAFGELHVLLHVRNGFVIHALLHIDLAKPAVPVSVIWFQLDRSLEIRYRQVVLARRVVDPPQVAYVQYGNRFKLYCARILRDRLLMPPHWREIRDTVQVMSQGRIWRQFDSPLVSKPGARLIIVQDLPRHRCHQLGVDNRVVELQSLLCRSPGFFEGVSRTTVKADEPKDLIGPCYADVGLRKGRVVLQCPFKVNDAVFQSVFALPVE